MVELDKKLLERLPRTFVPLLNEQLEQWETLFPAERRPIERTLEYLSLRSEMEVNRLFAPVKALEAKMDLPGWERSSQKLSIDETSVLARSPHYPQWRVEVAKVFATIDAATLAGDGPASNKLIVCVLPPGLPLGGGVFRPQFTKQGRWIRLEADFGAWIREFAANLAQRPAAPGTEPVEHTWVFECDSLISRQSAYPTLTALSYDALARARAEFRKHLNAIDKDLRSADQVYGRLRKLDIADLVDGAVAKDGRLAEFIRALFLSGNGAVLFNNSFIQWGAAEALRRAQPRALLCRFGVRQALKPFSSVVLFEDQNRANPVPDRDDPAGSLIDIQILCEYVSLTAARLPAYQHRTLGLFAAEDLDRLMLIAPPDFPLSAEDTDVVGLERLTEICMSWLSAA